jgi:hypothetical protein
MKLGRPPMAPVQPIAIIGIRHVPLAAGDKCYISFVTRRKDRADVFVAAHESLPGPKRHLVRRRDSVAFGSKAESGGTLI